MAGAALASALMAANYPGDSGEDVDRLISELAKRGYVLEAARAEVAEPGDDRIDRLEKFALWAALYTDDEHLRNVARQALAGAATAGREPLDALDVDRLARAMLPAIRNYYSGAIYDGWPDDEALGDLIGHVAPMVAREYAALDTPDPGAS